MLLTLTLTLILILTLTLTLGNPNPNPNPNPNLDPNQVRCQGVNADARRGSGEKADLDIPGLLSTHFPEHGPYLGVYAQVVEGGRVRLGDAVESSTGRQGAGE